MLHWRGAKYPVKEVVTGVVIEKSDGAMAASRYAQTSQDTS